MWKDPVTGEIRQGLKDTSYTHDFLIDRIIANPAMDQRELAKELGYSEGWISQIMASDSFQAAFERRKEEMVDPVMRHSLDVQFKALVLQSASILREKLEAGRDSQVALKVLEHASKALGYGARVKVEGSVEHKHSLVGILSTLPPPPPREKLVLPTAIEPEPAK